MTYNFIAVRAETAELYCASIASAVCIVSCAVYKAVMSSILELPVRDCLAAQGSSKYVLARCTVADNS